MARLHADEVESSLALVRRLIGAQFPEWAALPLRPLPGAGTDNAIYRLGDGMAVRLPRTAGAALRLEKEGRWLARLAPQLPLAVPRLLAAGVPAADFPFPWGIYQWIDGEPATLDRLAEPTRAATALADFVRALRGLDANGAPQPGPHNSGRGVPLAARDHQTRAAIDVLGARIDARKAIRIWERALEAPVWQGTPRWIHGDLQAGNLLARAGRLRAVIDFGCLGAGDPACDLQVAWNLFTAESRARFRDVLDGDEASWERGRGWALSVSVIVLPYYWDSNPALVAIARHALRELFAEPEG